MITKLFKLFKRDLNVLEHKNLFFIKQLDCLITDFTIIFDVGTYKGGFVDTVLNFNGNAQFHCFEPYSKSFDSLLRKYSDKKNVFINQAAVSDFNGEVFLNVNAFLETNSLLESQKVDVSIDNLIEKKETELVSVISLSDYCSGHKIEHIDLIKIDAQGNSFQVLQGLFEMLKNKQIRFLYVEVEFIEIYKNEKLFAEIDIFMKGLNYQIIDFYNLNYLNEYNLAWCDVLYGIKIN